MKNFSLAAGALCLILALNGCGVIVVASTALTTAKSAYDGYEALCAIKKVQEETPTLGTYRNLFVSFDVQPRNGDREEMSRMLEEIYARSIEGIAVKNGLKVTCRPHEEKAVAAGKSALVIQVREQKAPLWNRMVSGDKIHTSINYIDRKSTKVMAQQVNVAKNYEEMMRHLILSAVTRLNLDANSDRTPLAATVAYFTDKDQSIMTEQERMFLRKG